MRTLIGTPEDNPLSDASELEEAAADSQILVPGEDGRWSRSSLEATYGSLPPEYLDFFDRIDEKLGGSSAIEIVSEWLCKHTKIEDAPYSFTDHEFQIAIANDPAWHVIVKKPSQVGISELSLRISLALCAIRRNFPLIYVLPSAKFSGEFTKTRIDPVIETSQRLKDLIVKGSNGSHMKRLGSSILYIGGAATMSQAISRPAKGLVIDEKDHCNMRVLTAYSSRQRHIKPPDRPYKREFSTPTVAGYGIDEDYITSSQRLYLCKCEHCETWQAPDFKTQVVIPGFTRDGRTFEHFTKDDLRDSQVRVDLSYMACSHCGKSLDASLAEPSRREWVGQYEGVDKKGYAVKPSDLIVYNPIVSQVRQFGDYTDPADYWNYVQGETFASESNQVNKETVARTFTLVRLEGVGEGICAGIDVGSKWVYMILGRRVFGEDSKMRTEVVRRYRFRTQDGPFLEQIIEKIEEHGVVRVGIDAGPDYSLSKGVADFMMENGHACTYVRNSEKITEYYVVDDKSHRVAVQRTRAFDGLVVEMNAGSWLHNVGDEAEGESRKDLLDQYTGMKRVTDEDEQGEKKGRWEKTGDDHWLHAAMYLKTVLDIDESIYGVQFSSVVPGPTTILGAMVGVASGHSDTRDLMLRHGVR